VGERADPVVGAPAAERAQARRFVIAALGLSLAYLIVLACTAPAMGYTRDEGYYFKAAEQYGAWWDTLFSGRFFDAFGAQEIQLRFGYNTEHPALVKLIQGFTFRIFHKWLDWMGPAQGFRMAGFLFAAISLLATFLLGRELVSAKAGLLAATLMAVMPRYFYDAHLACFDVPITAMWTLTLWAFWRGLLADRGSVLRRALAAGLIFGLALATKLNALFLPPLLVLAWIHRGGFIRGFGTQPAPSGGVDVKLPPIPWVLIAMAVLGPLVFVISWPWLWHDTSSRIGAYVGFHMNHEHYPILFFQKMLVKPPFPASFAWTMSALTVPLPMLVLGLLGLAHAIYRAVVVRSTEDFLLAGACVLPLVLISLPGTPIFGGVKHWYNALPELAILAARSTLVGAEAVSERWRSLSRYAVPALSAMASLPGLLGTIASHPNGIGFYNELAGGFRGGAELGMQRSFWGGINRPLMPEVAKLPQGTRIFFDHMNWDAMVMYQREGTLPQGLYFANTPQEAQAATVFVGRENPTSAEAVWSSVGIRPSAGVYQDNVTMVEMYRRP
jgi:hypothetical protein